MNIAIKRAVVLMLAFALVAAACGDDDATSTAATTASTDAPASTEAPTASTAAPTTTTTTAAPATTQPAAMTPEEFVAEHMIPLPAQTELVSIEEAEGGTRVGAIVSAAPPPGYAATATAAGWNVLDVTFGSERTTATFENTVASVVYCMIAYANYDSSSSPDYWIYFWFFTGLTEQDCLDAGDRLGSIQSLLGSP